MLRIGTIVKVKPNTSLFDCCQGKRGHVAHMGVNGGYLLHTDHFCPIERTEDELEVIPWETIAQEIVDAEDPAVVKSYQEAPFEDLARSARGYDRLAWAVLKLQGVHVEGW